jgi:hypothetical protein
MSQTALRQGMQQGGIVRGGQVPKVDPWLRVRMEPDDAFREALNRA